MLIVDRSFTLLKMLKTLSFFLLIFCTSICACKKRKDNRQDSRSFPEGFIFGAASASYQVEGAWDEDGKAPNIWDHVLHKDPCASKDCSNGDIADDSYHLYKRDVEMTRELGIKYYRFSISWPRIMPSSFPDQINEAGVQHYNNFIDELLKYNIEPMITLYHWDLPQKLQELGGWANPYIVNWFADYARTAYKLFGDRVKYWITINEPAQICIQGYGDVTMAPRVNVKGVAEYMCTKNVLMGHAKAYHIYDEEYRASQNGVVFMAFSAQWYEPYSEHEVVAAEEANQFMWALYVHPIFAETGDYPQIVKERVAAKSAEQGFPRSRLIEFTPEEVDYVRGTADIFGLNHYTTLLVNRNASVNGYYDTPSFNDDLGVILYQTDDKTGESDFMKSVPWGFYKLLTKIREDYNNPTIFISENGFATHGGLMDNDRIQKMRNYLSAMLDAMEEGSDVKAFTVWSLIDNFEWLQGYGERFGLYEVDYEDSNRTRTPRKSAFVYKEIIKTHTLDFNFEPNETVMTIDEGH